MATLWTWPIGQTQCPEEVSWRGDAVKLRQGVADC
jgi:hypothetical protein